MDTHNRSREVELLRRAPFLAVLGRRDIADLAAAARRRRFRRGETVFQREDAGDALYIIDEGAVRIYLPSPRGAELTLAVLGPGDMFGEMAFLEGKSGRAASAAALEDTETVMLRRADFLRLLRARPGAGIAVLEVLARRLRETNDKAGDLVFLDVNGRLAKRLLELAERGSPGPSGVVLPPMTQEQLANLVGVTRESVNRHLRLFRSEGLVGGQGRRLVILDAEGLRAYAE